MKLFYKTGACSLSPHIVLQESGLNFTTEAVDLQSKKTASGEDFLKVNPRGQVPTLLLDDGTILTEGAAIVQYVADKVASKKLIPANGTIARYHAIEMLNYIATELHKGFSPLYNPQTPTEYKEATKQKLLKQFDYLNGILSQQKYLLGDHFSVADAYLFTVTRWAKPLGLDLSSYKHLVSYMQLIATRPAVIAAMKQEGLI